MLDETKELLDEILIEVGAEAVINQIIELEVNRKYETQRRKDAIDKFVPPIVDDAPIIRKPKPQSIDTKHWRWNDPVDVQMSPTLNATNQLEQELFKELFEDEIADGKPKACTICQQEQCKLHCPSLSKYQAFVNTKYAKRLRNDNTSQVSDDAIEKLLMNLFNV